MASVGSKGDSYDNALAEALNSLYKAELIRNHKYLDEHGPWEGIDDVEFATAEWVHWFNTVRPHSAIDMHAPIEHEQAYTPPDDTDTTAIGDTDTIAEAESEAETETMDVGEQTTNQPQPATTGAR